MEKTGQKYSVKDRFIPAALLIVGLVCASWLTVQKNQDSATLENNAFSQDTTGKKSKSSRTTIIRIDENGDTHEQVFESTEGDNAAFSWAAPMADFEIPEIPATPVMPSFDVIPAFPAMPSFPSVHAFPSPPAGAWRISPSFHDTIPGAWMGHGNNWEEFSKEFEKKFSEEFSDFYKNHEKDFDRMMKEMELKFKEEFEHGDLHGQILETDRLRELAQHEALANDEHLRIAEQRMAAAEELVSLTELTPLMAGMAALSSDLDQLDDNMRELHDQVEIFEGEVQEMLVKDGYLKKGEKIENIRWSDDEIEVNGKKIKDSDAKRYHEKHDKLFNSQFHGNKIE